MVSIFVKNLTRTYQNRVKEPFLALANIDLSIRDGEFLTVVGPSGAGKSSLLRVIAGLDQPSAGQVLYGNEPVLDIPPSDRGVAILFQDAPLYPELTVFENLMMAAKRADLPTDEMEAKIKSLAIRFQFDARLGRRSEQLSKGERQRIALVRSLLYQPRLLLLDEPFTGLDPELRFLVRREILSWHEQTGATVVCVTHEPFDGFTMGDRVLVMDRGRVQQLDTPGRVSEYPVNKFVASFIGYPPMNFLAGTIGDDSTGFCFLMETTVEGSNPFTIGVPPALRERMGRTVVAGIRPGEIHLDPDIRSSANGFEAEVRRVDRFEEMAFVEVTCGTKSLVVRDRSEYVFTESQRVRVLVKRCVWFDGETLERIG